MSLPAVLNRHNTSGFYQASISKVILGTLATCHVGLNLAMFSHLPKYLICKLPDSIQKGEYWRVLTSKVAFLETRDTIFCLILFYYFRIFERRLGSRKFASHLLAMLLISTILEYSIISLFQFASQNITNLIRVSGLLATGPYYLVLPWFVFYFKDIPSLNSTSVMGMRVSNKAMPYLMGLQVILGSASNTIMAVCCILTGLIIKSNGIWIQKWCVVPKFIGSICEFMFGWIVNSSPPEEGAIGATLEIQRSQQMEAIEQQFMQQQNRVTHRMPNARRIPAPEPTEANITTLVDMGFPRERAIEALREAHNDLSTATAILLRNT